MIKCFTISVLKYHPRASIMIVLLTCILYTVPCFCVFQSALLLDKTRASFRLLQRLCATFDKFAQRQQHVNVCCMCQRLCSSGVSATKPELGMSLLHCYIANGLFSKKGPVPSHSVYLTCSAINQCFSDENGLQR